MHSCDEMAGWPTAPLCPWLALEGGGHSCPALTVLYCGTMGPYYFTVLWYRNVALVPQCDTVLRYHNVIMHGGTILLYCYVAPYLVLLCDAVLFWPTPAVAGLWGGIWRSTVHYTASYFTVPHHTAPYFTILHRTTPYFTVLHHTSFYFTVPHCTSPYL